MTEINVYKDIKNNNDIVFSGRISTSDLLEANFDELDNLVLNSPEENIADILQSLELIARRIIQSKNK